MSLPAITAQIVFDGLALESPTEAWQIERVPEKVILRGATGDRRQQIAEPLPGHPTLRVKRTFTIGWSNLGDDKDRLERALSDPGQHQLALWRPEYVQYLGDGARTEFHLPNRWILATDSAQPPGGVSPSHFYPEVRIGLDGDVFTYRSQDAATYDAGSPPAGEVWFLAGGSRFQLAAPPVAGGKIFLKVVPRYLVFDAGPQSTNLPDPVREPRELVLLER